MTYIQGMDFRATKAFVTDPTNYDVDTLNSTGGSDYPFTSAQGNTVGWTLSPSNGEVRDRSASIDPRLAGFAVGGSTGGVAIFRFDLPASGNYKIGLGAGDHNYGSSPVYIEVFDNLVTSLGVLANGSTGAANTYLDATNTLLTAAAWPGSNTLVTKTFSSTICTFHIGQAAAVGVVCNLFVQATGGGATRGPFLLSLLNGVSTGGPFFANPIG